MKQLIRKLRQLERDLLKQIPKAFEYIALERADSLARGYSWNIGYVPYCDVLGAYFKLKYVGAHTIIDAANHNIIVDESKLDVRDYAAAADYKAFACWRFTRRIYNIDPTLLSSINNTLIPPDTPTALFRRLPEWGMYINLPGLTSDLTGFFVSTSGQIHNTKDHETVGEDTLDIIMYGSTSKVGYISFPLGDSMSVQESLDTVLQNALEGSPGDVLSGIARARLILSVVLYLCSEAPDYKGGTPGGKPKLGIKGKFEFPKDPRVIQVGSALGAKLREQSTQPTGAGKKPHLRKAHWHGVWTGPKNDPIKKQVFKLNWIPPLFVNCDPPTI